MTDLVHCLGCDLPACEGIEDRHLPDIAAMAKAGQALALKWGHQPWSDPWARLVAGAMLATCPEGLDAFRLTVEGDRNWLLGWCVGCSPDNCSGCGTPRTAAAGSTEPRDPAQ